MKTKEQILYGVIAAEASIPALVFFLQPGFDKPNSLGLDFNFVVLMAVFELIVWIAGTVVSIGYIKEKIRYLVWHVAVVPCLAVLFLVCCCR